MAGKTTTRGSKAGASSAAAAGKGLDDGTRERLREVVSLLLLGMTLFIALACASAGRGDNLCGPTGERVALLLIGTFGYASWLLVVCFALWGLVLFTRVQTQSLSVRASGLGLCLVTTAALLTHLLGDVGLRFAPGGVVGEFLHEQLMVTGGLGLVGTRIVLIMLTLVTFVLATDVAYYAALVGSLRWLTERGSALKEAREVAKEEAAAENLKRTKEEAKRLANEAKLIREEAKLVRAQAAADRAAAKAAKEAAKAAAAAGLELEDDAGGVAVEDFAPGDLEEVDLGSAEDNAAEVAAAEDAFDGVDDDADVAVVEDEEPLTSADFEEAWTEDEAAAADDDEDDEDDDGSLAATAVEDAADEELDAGYEDDEEFGSDELEAVEGEDEEDDGIVYDDDADPVLATAKLFDDDTDEEDEELAADEEYEDDDEELASDEEYEDEGEELAADEEYEDDDEELAADEEYEDEVDADDVAVDPELEAVARSRPKVREMVDTASQRPLPFSPPETSAYVFPSEDLLDDQEQVDQAELDELLADKTSTLERTLLSFKVEARVVEIQKGPVISMFEMALAPGIKLGKVKALEDDLAIALRARSVRIVAPIPGKNTIGIEVPNPIRETVRLKPLLHCREFDDKKQALPLFLGRDSAGRPQVADLARMPHLLVAGATGSGKSVCLNTIICSLLYTRTPEQVKLILIDPKMVEMTLFSQVPHLACPVITDMKRAPGILEWAVNKMEERYQLLSRAGVRNIAGYNKLSEERLRSRFGDVIESEDFPRKLPFIVIVVDELADLMMTAAKDVETSISRLAAKSRAVGIHIILATQRPSTNVITGLIKANLPTRIAFMVSSKIDSRVILDGNGAEQLLGQGDMLMLSPANVGLQRGQCTFMSDEEVTLVTEAIASEAVYERELVQRRKEGAPDPCEVDELYDAAARFIIDTRRGSASLLQRKFAIGYTRASRLIDLMAEEGVLGEFKGSQARDVELTLEEWIAINPEAREASDEEGGDDGWEDEAETDEEDGAEG